MSLDLSQDYLLIDDPVTVSYEVKRSEASFGLGGQGGSLYADPVSIAYVYQEALTKEDVLKNRALLQGTNGVFNLWKANLQGIVPKIGDLITDAESIVWVVIIVQMMDRDANGIQRFRCLALKEE